MIFPNEKEFLEVYYKDLKADKLPRHEITKRYVEMQTFIDDYHKQKEQDKKDFRRWAIGIAISCLIAGAGIAKVFL